MRHFLFSVLLFSCAVVEAPPDPDPDPEPEPDPVFCDAIEAGPAFPCQGCVIANASPGTSVNFGGFDPLTAVVPLLDVVDSGAKLLFSDSPESFTSGGILYADNLAPGLARVYLHHDNGTSVDKKLAVVIKNVGSSAGTIQIQAVGRAGPSSDFVLVGKRAMQRYLDSTPGVLTNIAANEAILLEPALSAEVLNPGELVSAIYDFTTTQPLQVFVIAVDPNTNPLQAFGSLPILPRDSHQRGSFLNANRAIKFFGDCVYDPAQGAARIRIGGDNPPPPTGIDVLTNAQETIAGHYGLRYEFTLPSKGTGSFALVLNPRGGAFGGAVRITAGGFTRTLDAPADTLSLSDNTQGVLLGRANAGETVKIITMPPGASNLPVDLLLLPLE